MTSSFRRKEKKRSAFDSSHIVINIIIRLTTGRASTWRPAFVPQGPRSRLKVRSPLSTATSGETSS